MFKNMINDQANEYMVLIVTADYIIKWLKWIMGMKVKDHVIISFEEIIIG